MADALPPLRDRIRPGVRVLFVGINPGIRSSQTGHHFAGFSNRFWMLLFESRLVPERITYEDDDRLAEWGYGITNIVRAPDAGNRHASCRTSMWKDGSSFDARSCAIARRSSRWSV